MSQLTFPMPMTFRYRQPFYLWVSYTIHNPDVEERTIRLQTKPKTDAIDTSVSMAHMASPPVVRPDASCDHTLSLVARIQIVCGIAVILLANSGQPTWTHSSRLGHNSYGASL